MNFAEFTRMGLKVTNCLVTERGEGEARWLHNLGLNGMLLLLALLLLIRRRSNPPGCHRITTILLTNTTVTSNLKFVSEWQRWNGHGMDISGVVGRVAGICRFKRDIQVINKEILNCSYVLE